MRGAIAGRSSSVSWQQRTSCRFSLLHFQLLPSLPRQHSLMLATSQTHQSLSTRFDELEVELQVHPHQTRHIPSHRHMPVFFFQSMVSRFVQKGSDKHFCTLQTHVEEKKMLEQPEPEATKSFMHRGSNASSSKDQYKSNDLMGCLPPYGRRKQADQASKVCLGLFHDWPFFRP